ncbi:integrase [Mycobacterium sp. Soil538]|nr:integrase [Mycobacterium sp. Soil538]
MSRNANGEGSIYGWKKNGKPAGYKGALSYKDDNGATKRFVAYGRTRKDVKDKLDKARDRLAEGAPVKDSKQSVGDWLAYWRVTGLAASSRKESTKVLYGNLSRKHLEPEPFGSIGLDRLKPSDVDALLLAMRQKMKPANGSDSEQVRALSDSTIFNVYCVLRAGLDGAVRDNLIARNPATRVDRPQVAKKEAKHISAADLSKLLTAAEGLRYRDVLVLIAGTGLRRGEAVALSWSNVNLDSRNLRVEGTLSRVGKELLITEPKTQRSRRTVPLSPPMVALLKTQKARQAADRLRAGNVWTDTGLVFTTEFGTAVDPRNILRTVELAAKKAGLDKTGVHTLRHSAATGWLESGVHIKAVSDLLGHSSIAITGDIYGHTSDDTARQAIDGWSGALGL